jgi:hypothetical protein
MIQRGGRQSVLWISLLAVSVVVFCFPLPAHEPITTKVTFNKEVIRIFSQRCLGCHQTGGFAPMSLGTYADARPWAKAIKEEILERRMPPWNAAKGFGDYGNDRSLSQLEIELVVDWVEGGAPKGEDKDLPKPVVSDDPGKPDLVVDGGMSAVVKWQRWITGWMFTPASGAADSAEFWIEDAAKKRTYLGAWVPPERFLSWPDDVAQSLPAGSRVIVKPHFPDGVAADGTGRLALFFALKPPLESIRHMSLACGATSLPAGASALALMPRGPMEVEASLPDGETDVLGLFRADKPGYHPTYRFRRPVVLPAGSKISAHSAGAAGACTAMLTYTSPKPPRPARQDPHGQ